MVLTLEKLLDKRPRNEYGQYVKSSELDAKMTGARLRKDYSTRLREIAKERGMTTTDLVREILEDYVREYDKKAQDES